MIIVYGMTKCRICREVINEGDRIVTIPSIVDRSSKFYVFSDAPLHYRCFDAHPLKYELRSMLEAAYDPPNDQQRLLLAYIDQLLTGDDSIAQSDEENNDDKLE